MKMMKTSLVRLLGSSLSRNGRGHLQEPEIRHVVVARAAAGAHADQLDLRDDEPVATAVLAHAALQMGQAVEVLDLAVGRLVAHARVPPIEALDHADEAAAREARARAVCVAGVVGEEVRAAGVFGAGGVAERGREVKAEVFWALGDGEGGVDARGVDVVDELDEGGLGFWGEPGGGHAGCGDEVGRDLRLQELREAVD